MARSSTWNAGAAPQPAIGGGGIITPTGTGEIWAFSKTIRAARKARTQHEPLWDHWRRQLQGRWYKGEGPVRMENVEFSYAWRILQDVAARLPKVSVRARKEFVDAMTAKLHEVAVNAIFDRQKFHDELRMAVHDSLYAGGFIKTGLHPTSGAFGGDMLAADAGLLDGTGGGFDPTMPFAERISPWTMLWDDAAEHWNKTEFYGHEFMRSLDAAIQDDRYDINARLMFRDQTSLLSEAERHRRYGHIENLGPMIRLVELWVRHTNELWTLYEVGPTEFRVVRKVPFHGPDRGPIRCLGYLNVPDKVLPYPLYAGWRDLAAEHEINLRQMTRQHGAYKRVATVSGQAAKKDGKLIQKVDDDHLIEADEQTKFGSIEIGGLSDTVVKWYGLVDGLLDRQSGLTDMRMGVAGQGNTATETSIVNNNASSSIQEMRRNVGRFVEDIADDIGWYVHNDQSVMVSGTIRGEDGMPADIEVYGGMDIDPMTGLPIEGQSGWEDFYTSVNPDELWISTDQLDKAQAREQAEFVLGILRPALNSQGFDINMLSFARDTSEKMGMRSIESWIVPMNPMAMAMGMQSMMSEPGGGQIKDAMTTRQPGADPVQSGIMNGAANPAISAATQAASPMREAMTPAGSNNSPRGM
ncbi:MAG: hypothetical protein ACIAQU_04315 [Phycisphaerales bacterium JB064]